MAAYSYGTTPQQRKWMYDLVMQGDYDLEQQDRIIVALFGHQTTYEFLDVAVSPVPHAQRLQFGAAAIDQFLRRYHPWPEGDDIGLVTGSFQTNRFFVALRSGKRAEYVRSREPSEQLTQQQQLPAVDDLLQLTLSANITGSHTVRVMRVDDIRDASAIVTFDRPLRVQVDFAELQQILNSVIREEITK